MTVTPNRALIFHSPGFEPDLAALRAASPRDVEIRTYSTVAIGSHFLRVFDQSVLGVDFSSYAADENARRRARWREIARSLVLDLYSCYPFDVAIAPADDTAYWREVVHAVQELGIAFIVVYKETTHPDGQLQTLAPLIHRYYPVSASHVLVNSERTARFVRDTGARPEQVTVVGQPRFDFYAKPAGVDWSTLGLDPRRPTVLFLSYEIDAYLPLEERATVESELAWFLRRSPSQPDQTPPESVRLKTWLPQRSESEQILAGFAARAGWNLAVKPHVQMRPEDRALDREVLRRAASKNSTVPWAYLDPYVDVRPLIAGADMVVGFQTTALLEAMASEKRVIYAGWHEPSGKNGEDLIPFTTWKGALEVATSPADLESILGSAGTDWDDTLRRRIVEEWLGPVDGGASQRVWAFVAAYDQGSARAARHDAIWRRARLEGGRRSAARQLALLRIARVLTRAVAALYPPARRLVRLLDAADGRARSRRQECDTALRGALPRDGELTGMLVPIFDAVATLARARLTSRR